MSDKKNIKLWQMSVGIALIVVSIILVLWFLMRGETKISNNITESYKDETLICYANNYGYPFFEFDQSIQKNMDIRFVFDGDQVRSIALKYTLRYEAPNLVSQSEGRNHAAMNKSFGADNLGADAINASYSIQDDKLIMTLYAGQSEINNVTKKYFLIDDVTYSQSTVDDYEKFYMDKGFNCNKSK